MFVCKSHNLLHIYYINNPRYVFTQYIQLYIDTNISTIQIYQEILPAICCVQLFSSRHCQPACQPFKPAFLNFSKVLILFLVWNLTTYWCSSHTPWFNIGRFCYIIFHVLLIFFLSVKIKPKTFKYVKYV